MLLNPFPRPFYVTTCTRERGTLSARNMSEPDPRMGYQPFVIGLERRDIIGQELRAVPD
jgi:hypothetical protein